MVGVASSLLTHIHTHYRLLPWHPLLPLMCFPITLGVIAKQSVTKKRIQEPTREEKLQGDFLRAVQTYSLHFSLLFSRYTA